MILRRQRMDVWSVGTSAAFYEWPMSLLTCPPERCSAVCTVQSSKGECKKAPVFELEVWQSQGADRKMWGNKFQPGRGKGGCGDDVDTPSSVNSIVPCQVGKLCRCVTFPPPCPNLASSMRFSSFFRCGRWAEVAPMQKNAHTAGSAAPNQPSDPLAKGTAAPPGRPAVGPTQPQQIGSES